MNDTLSPVTLTKAEAVDYIRHCGEDEGPETYAEAAAIFSAIFARPADPDDGTQHDLWSHACAAVE